MASRRPLTTVTTLILAASFLIVGAWMFLAPHSFYVQVAPIGPYSRHFMHDAGAFQLGLGVALVLALFRSDALLVILTGTAVASWTHVLSHVFDWRQGGHPLRDVALLTALSALCTAAAVDTARVEPPSGTPS
ncbi:MAG: hypothetical protein JWO68_85 [Actinomycetia bacterium]|nr:hypothetical protein [Actinomycetes bacterium]